jgi:hypothetical protein
MADVTSPDETLDYFETVQTLNGWAGKLVIVYPVVDSVDGDEPADFMSGLSAWGTLKAQGDPAASGRRQLSGFYETQQPELALGDMPLELYERQAAYYTFEGMDDLETRFAGFTLWQHRFIEARWLALGGRFHWLWIRARPIGLIVAEEFQPLPVRPASDD